FMSSYNSSGIGVVQTSSCFKARSRHQSACRWCGFAQSVKASFRAARRGSERNDERVIVSRISGLILLNTGWHFLSRSVVTEGFRWAALCRNNIRTNSTAPDFANSGISFVLSKDFRFNVRDVNEEMQPTYFLLSSGSIN